MRHLETVEVSESNSSTVANGDESTAIFDIKQEDLEELTSEIVLKSEIPDISLDDCEPFMKDEFVALDDDDLGFDIAEAESNLWKFPKGAPPPPPTTSSGRKNKRKSQQPQKKKKSPEDSGNSKIDSEREKFDSNSDSSELPESDEVLNKMDEDNIFKGLSDEKTTEEGLEMIDNVKEEFRSHWGVKCNMCEKVFPYRSDFDEHYTTTYNMTPVYTCAFCNKTVEKYNTFRSHCYRHITEGRYKCTKCTKAFCLQSLLQVHVLNKHGKVKPYVCDECGKNFMTQAGLKMHVRKHQSEIKEDYPCVVCGKVLHTRGGLTSHMNVHRLGRRFMCDVCGKTFTQKVNMQQHAKQHTGDKPHRCDKCGKTFAEKSHLARHYSFHSDQRPYKCEVCSKMYKTERCLKVHSMVHAEERPFICTYCNKGFLSSTKLKQHYNVHTGERPFVCKYCQRTFTNYPNWLKHIRRRHKVDHKTGKNLETNTNGNDNNLVMKVEENANSNPNGSVEIIPISEPPPQLIPSITQDFNIAIDTQSELSSDLVLTKTEELILQQTFMQYPIAEDKYIFQAPQMDNIYNGNMSNGSSTVIVPFFQTIPPTAPEMLPMVTDISQHFMQPQQHQIQLPTQQQ